MERKTNIKLLFTLTILTFVGWVYLSRFCYPFTSDSATYIEIVRSLKQGKGFINGEYSSIPLDTDWSPLKLFPPGYPILVFLTLGWWISDAVTASVLFEAIFFSALPFLFWKIFRQVISDERALLTSFLSVWTYALVDTALKALSDIPFLALTLLSLLFLFSGIRKKKWMFFFFSGLCGGLALLTRNVGYSLIFASFCTGIFLLITNLKSWRKWLIWAGSYLAGFLGLYGLWITRNFLTFGKIQPYKMAPSELSWIYNIKQFFRTLTLVFMGSNDWSIFFIAILATIAFGWVVWFCLQWLRNKRFIQNNFQKVAVWGTLAIYGLSGTAIVIAARSTYKWGEQINTRHILQYQWIIILVLIATEMYFVRKIKFRIWRNAAGVAGIIVLIGFIGVQTNMLKIMIKKNNIQRNKMNHVRKNLIPAIHNLPEGSYIASNFGPLLRIYSGRSIRQLSSHMSIQTFTDKLQNSNRKSYVVLYSFRFDKAVQWKPYLDNKQPPKGFNVTMCENDFCIFEYTKLKK